MTGLVVILFEDESFELIPGTMRGIVVVDLLGGFKGLKSDAGFFEKGVWEIYFFSVNDGRILEVWGLWRGFYSQGWPNDEAYYVIRDAGAGMSLGWSCDVSLVCFRPIQSFLTGERTFVSV